MRNLHRVAGVPLLTECVGSEIFPGDEVVKRLASRLAPVHEGTTLRADPQAGDVAWL
jgi:hypothetical protein